MTSIDRWNSWLWPSQFLVTYLLAWNVMLRFSFEYVSVTFEFISSTLEFKLIAIEFSLHISFSSRSRALAFSVLRSRPFLDRFFGFGVCCGFCAFSPSLFGFRQKLDPVIGFAIRCGLVFFRFLFGKYAPQQRARLLGFCLRFSVLIEISFGFLFFVRFCGFLYTPMPHSPRTDPFRNWRSVSVELPRTVCALVIFFLPSPQKKQFPTRSTS